MRIGFTADVHCHNWTAFSTRLPSGRNSRLEDCLKVFKQAKRMAEAGQLHRFFVLGDLFHARYKIDVDVFYAAWEAIRDLNAVIPVVLLRGNHDCYLKAGDTNSIEAFKTLCEVADSPRAWNLEGFSIRALPWCDSAEVARQQLQQIDSCDLLLVHQGIQEAAIGPYGMTGHGGLSVKDLPLDRVKYVFAGDYHKRQFFGPSGRVHYIGSPCQLTFGEAGEEKAITVVDTSNFEILTYLTDAPRFYKCRSVEHYEELSACGEIRKGIDFVKIECSEQCMDAAQQLAASTHTVLVEQISADRQALARADAAVTESDSVLIDEYVRMRVPAERRERYAAVGRELLSDVCDE